MMTELKLPLIGVGKETRITKLRVGLGQQHDTSSEVFVHGRCIKHGAEVEFAGTTVIAEGQGITHDIQVGGKHDGEFLENLVVMVHHVLDEFAVELVAGEMERICG